MVVNRILRIFGYKIIPSIDVFEWVGGEYHLPMRVESSVNVVDKNNKMLHINLENEEDARLLVNTINLIYNKK